MRQINGIVVFLFKNVNSSRHYGFSGCAQKILLLSSQNVKIFDFLIKKRVVKHYGEWSKYKN